MEFAPSPRHDHLTPPLRLSLSRGIPVLLVQLLGWSRTWRFWVISWITAFLCEFSSTRNGIPFGWYHYTGSTVGQELYLSNIPFMDSLSFSFLLYASYCLALLFMLPRIGEKPFSSAHTLPDSPI